jgi:hypothetical protein
VRKLSAIRVASLAMILAAFAICTAGAALAQRTPLFYTSCAAAILALIAFGLSLYAVRLTK